MAYLVIGVMPLLVKLNRAPWATGSKLSREVQEEVSTHGTSISNTLNFLCTLNSGANISLSATHRHCMPSHSGKPGSWRNTLNSDKLSIAAMISQKCDHWASTPLGQKTVKREHWWSYGVPPTSRTEFKSNFSDVIRLKKMGLMAWANARKSLWFWKWKVFWV